MSDLALALRQVRYENVAFWRNPAAAFFTFAFPLIFMVILNVLFGGDRDAAGGYGAGYFFTPSIVALSVVTACYTNIAMSVTTARDEGILKRIRGTPLPVWAYLCGRVGQAVLVAVLLVVIVAGFGLVTYGVPLPVERLPAILVTLVLGAATFSALGLAVSGFVPNAEAAPAVVNASVLPLMFISNVFVPVGPNFPAVFDTLSKLFPIRHFADSLIRLWDPRTTGVGLEPVSLLVLALWGVGALVVANRFFSWEPRT